MRHPDLIWTFTSVAGVAGSALPALANNPPVILDRTPSTTSCNQDNCFRELLDSRFSSMASTFCATYTAHINSEPTAIPDYLENCQQSPSRVSSACSCLITSSTPSSSSTGSGSISTSAQVEPTTSSTTISTSQIKVTSTVSSTLVAHPTSTCKNGPNSRRCWSGGFDISTNVETHWPITGKVVSYHLEVSEKTLSPDGTPKQMLVVNGKFPGPLITADWGDMLQITVKNSLNVNGTSMHWHGFRQLNSNSEDGADGVTECPLPPGESRTYKFLATQHGTSWYHSHFVEQYGDGVVGPIVIKGPATENYDYDLGALPITDHYYMSMYQSSLIAMRGIPPLADNGLINGRNKNAARTLGSFHTQAITPGKTYRLRLINTSVGNGFKVHLDGHRFKVFQADFVPIVPYETDWVFLHIGQRYDVIFTASKIQGNYWFRAVAPTACALMSNNDGIRAIFNNGVEVSEPTTNATIFLDECSDEKTLVPYIKDPVPKEKFDVSGNSNLTVTVDVAPVIRWKLNGTPMRLDLGKPTLEYIQNGDFSYRSQPNLQIYELPKKNAWHFLLVQNTIPVPHPLHLHGHDFRILGSSFGPGSFTNATIATLNFENPPSRDTITLPGLGWVALAFKTDNPGAWLFHCHIVWHFSEGMGIQFLERPDEIKKTLNLEYLKPECKSWRQWFQTSPFPIEPPV